MFKTENEKWLLQEREDGLFEIIDKEVNKQVMKGEGADLGKLAAVCEQLRIYVKGGQK